MTTIVTRQGKGTPLTWVEMDANLTNLNTDKLESTSGSSVDSEIALFNGTTGKSMKRATSTGILKATSGVMDVASSSDILTTIGTIPIANGGTNSTTSANARTALGLAIGTDVLGYVAPGSNGNVLTSNGTAWTSSPPAGGASSGRLISTRYYPASAGTFTVTIASPGVFTKIAHGYPNGMMCRFTTTGALPTGLAINTTYFIINTAAHTYNVSLTEGGAAINTSGTQSGTHAITPIYDKSINSPTSVEVEGVGGGGGGGGDDVTKAAHGGAGGGGFRETLLASALGATETITIGAGGAGGVSQTSGGAGGTTSFGSHVSATGGGGGTINSTIQSATPGIGTGGDVNINGGAGGVVTDTVSGFGGGSQFAGTTRGVVNAAGMAATSPGGGGAGSGGSGHNGGAGFRGLVIVREYA